MQRGYGKKFVLVGLCSVIFTFSGAHAADDLLREACIAGAENGDVGTCQEAVASNPDDPEVRRQLAKAYMAIGDYDQAVVVYREIAASDPNDPGLQYEFASMLGFVRRYAEAVDPIETALRLNPDNLGILKLAAMVYHQVDREPESFRATLRAAELGDPASMYDMSWHYENGKGVDADPGKALGWVIRAAEAGHIGAMDTLVQTYLEGRYGQEPDDAKAVEWATRARQAREAQ